MTHYLSQARDRDSRCFLHETALCYFFFFCLLSFLFLGLHLQHKEVPRLGSSRSCSHSYVAIATWDLHRIFDLHHSSWQWWILNPLSKARDRIHIHVDTSLIHFHWATMGTPPKLFWLTTQMNICWILPTILSSRRILTTPPRSLKFIYSNLPTITLMLMSALGRKDS